MVDTNEYGDDVINFTPPLSLAEFFYTEKFISLACGPVGSTKTSAGIVRIAYEASRMAACKDGIRRSKAIWVRNTREQLNDTSIPDFLNWFPSGVAGVFQKTGLKFLLKFGDVECLVLFRGLDDSNDVRRVLSLQASFAIFDEFREINQDVFEAVQGRLGRYPNKAMVPHRPEWGVDEKGTPVGGCVDDYGNPMQKLWGMTNAPDMDTFWEKFLTDPPDNAHVTIQPSGMSPEADWLQYLPSMYYENLSKGKSEEYVDVYVHSKFGKSLSGQPVFRCFDMDTHVSKTPLNVLGSTIVIGVDAGLNPTATISQQTYDGRVLIHDCITGTEGGMGAVRFIREKLRPLLSQKYPSHAYMVIIDPAAFQRAQTDERCVADMFKNEGFLVKPAITNAISARIGVCESYMTRTINGKAALLIDPAVKLTIAALRGKYRYKINRNGETDSVPDKNHPHSDVADSLQYALLQHDGGAILGKTLGNMKKRAVKSANSAGWT